MYKKRTDTFCCKVLRHCVRIVAAMNDILHYIHACACMQIAVTHGSSNQASTANVSRPDSITLLYLFFFSYHSVYKLRTLDSKPVDCGLSVKVEQNRTALPYRNLSIDAPWPEMKIFYLLYRVVNIGAMD